MTTTQQPRNVIGALVLISLGAIFLLSNFMGGIGWMFSTLWPLTIMLPGLGFFAVALFGNRNHAGFFFPGTILTGIGGILLFQNVTDYWQSWAYAWALIPLFVGIALTLAGNRTGNEGEFRTGRSMIVGSGITFLAFAALFELFIFNSVSGAWTFVLPILLIVAGVYVFFNGHTTQPTLRTTAPIETKTKRKTEQFSFDDDFREEQRVVELNGRNQRLPAGQNLRRKIDAELRDDETGS